MSAEPDRRFGGIARLYGPEAQATLAGRHVCVIGIGGVGSWAVEALARSGIGRLTLIDMDHIAESNLNRQIHALENTLGQAKVVAMRERIHAINPACQVTAIEEFISAENVGVLLPADSFVLDAIDQVPAKAALLAYCRDKGLPVVTTGGAGGRTDPSQIRVDDLARTSHDPLASALRVRLRRHHGFPKDPKQPFGIPCVYTLEAIQKPLTTCEADNSALQGLNCAGYGSSVCVTAGFGLAAASRVLAGILTK